MHRKCGMTKMSLPYLIETTKIMLDPQLSNGWVSADLYKRVHASTKRTLQLISDAPEEKKARTDDGILPRALLPDSSLIMTHGPLHRCYKIKRLDQVRWFCTECCGYVIGQSMSGSFPLYT